MVGCEKEDTTGGNNGSGNNNGSIITDDDTGIELNMSNSGSDYIIFYTSFIDDGGFTNTNQGKVELNISSSNNFILHGNYSYYMSYDIASIGSVTSLSTITNIPSSGWVKQIAVNPGTGYVIRYRGNGFGYTYARLYVKDWLVSTGGGIIGATVIYQDKWGEESNDNNLVGTKWRYLDGGIVDMSLDFLTESNGIATNIIYDGEDYEKIEINFSYYYYYASGVITLENDAVGYNFFVEGNQLFLTNENGTVITFTKVL